MKAGAILNDKYLECSYKHTDAGHSLEAIYISPLTNKGCEVIFLLRRVIVMRKRGCSNKNISKLFPE